MVVKAGSDSRRDRVRREAEILRRLRGSRVVELVECNEAADHTELVTERFGVLTLADAPLMELSDRRSALLSLCSAVADLHDSGWAHGSLWPEHVLVGPRGRVRLCSLGSASQIATSDPSSTADDLADLAAVVGEVLSAEATFGSPLQRLRWRLATGRALRRLHGVRGMLGARPTGELLATLLPAPRNRRVAPARMTLAAGLATAAVASLALFSLRDKGEEGPPKGSNTAASANPTTPIAVTDPVPRQTATTVAGEPPVVTLDGVRYRVGLPGDIVEPADWDCGGTSRAVLLRPSTGEVFAFDSWASPGRPVSSRLVGSARGAVGLHAVQGCGWPVAEWPGGERAPIQIDSTKEDP